MKAPWLRLPLRFGWSLQRDWFIVRADQFLWVGIGWLPSVAACGGMNWFRIRGCLGGGVVQFLLCRSLAKKNWFLLPVTKPQSSKEDLPSPIKKEPTRCPTFLIWLSHSIFTSSNIIYLWWLYKMLLKQTYISASARPPRSYSPIIYLYIRLVFPFIDWSLKKLKGYLILSFVMFQKPKVNPTQFFFFHFELIY